MSLAWFSHDLGLRSVRVLRLHLFLRATRVAVLGPEDEEPASGTVALVRRRQAEEGVVFDAALPQVLARLLRLTLERERVLLAVAVLDAD